MGGHKIKDGGCHLSKQKCHGRTGSIVALGVPVVCLVFTHTLPFVSPFSKKREKKKQTTSQHVRRIRNVSSKRAIKLRLYYSLYMYRTSRLYGLVLFFFSSLGKRCIHTSVRFF